VTRSQTPLVRPSTGHAAGPLDGVLLVVEHHWTWYRRNWRATAASSILQPLLFLLAFGVGFGALIDDTGRAAQATGGLDYLVWLAPALLCVSAVQTGVFDSTYPVLSGLKWQRHYLAMTATPIGPGQVVAGHLAWTTIKIGGCGAIYVAVIAAFGGVRSPGIVTALPVHKGENVQPGTKLLTLANIDQMQFTLYISEAQIGHVKVGQKVQMNVDGLPERTFDGQHLPSIDRADKQVEILRDPGREDLLDDLQIAAQRQACGVLRR